MAEAVRVYVVVPFEPARNGLVAALRDTERIEVVGYAGSLREMGADERYRRADAVVAAAQVFMEPELVTSYPWLSEAASQLSILLLGTPEQAAEATPETIAGYMQLANMGFLFETGPTERLVHAIHLFASGAFVSEIAVIKDIASRLLRRWQPREQAGQLSGRESQVLGLVAHGMSNKEIARALSVSENTVKAHISHIMSKLGRQHRTELVRYALAELPARQEPTGDLIRA